MCMNRRLRQVSTALGVIRTNPHEIRHLSRLLASRGHSTIDLRLPWLPFSVIDMLAGDISRDATVFEFGGGGSTAWFADRAARVVTVEHDEDWYRVLVDAMADRSNVEILYVANLDNYASMIDSCGTAEFDVVLVDGRERVACVERAKHRIKRGGRLILDDSNRPKYKAASAILSDWTREEFFGFAPCKDEPGFTTVWTRHP